MNGGCIVDEERLWTLASVMAGSFAWGFIAMALLGPDEAIIPPVVNGFVAATCGTLTALLSWRGAGG